MSKLTVYGELYLEDQDWSDEWCGEVELDDEQAGNLIKLIMFNGGDTDVEYIGLKETYPDIYDILDKACYKATLETYNEYLRSCGKPEVDKLDFEHEVNIPYEFQDLF
jgi:hypothetical protein